MSSRPHLLRTLRLVVDGLMDYAPALKRRDPREPGRRRKEQAEDVLMLWVQRHFRRQLARIRERLEAYPLKAKLPPQLDDILEPDEEEIAALIRLLRKNTIDGISLFGASVGVAIDYTLTNAQAAEWASKYAYDLVKGIDKVTRDVLSQAVTMFVETPGFTIGDLVDMLPFAEERALNIATTEVTRAYAQGQLLAGEELRDEFPDVKIVKQWFTNNDDRVCELCSPLDGMIVPFDDNFYTPENEYQDGNPPIHSRCRCWLETSTDILA